VGLKKQHDITNLFLLIPCLLYHGDTFFADTVDPGKLFDFIFDDIQCLFSKFFNNSTGHNRSEPFDESGTQIFSNSINGCRNRGLGFHNLELLAKSGMINPFATHIENFAWCRRHQVSHYCNQIPLSVNFYSGNGETGLVVRVCNSFNLAGKLRKHDLVLIPSPATVYLVLRLCWE